MKDHDSSNNGLAISALLEAILFVASEPISPSQLGLTLGLSSQQVERALDDLEAHYSQYSFDRGLRLQRHHGRVQLTTAPQASKTIETFLGLESTTKLSQAALEALSIIAYREPVTRPQIDAIRGVNSDGVLRSLMSKGLIEEVGRANSPGRPILYSITTDFLQHFGLKSIQELPPLSEESHASPPDNGDQEI